MKKELIQIKLVEWFDNHFYKIRYINEAKEEVTDYFPSTTTKLEAKAKPFLGTWRGDIGNREADLRMKEAAKEGTVLHHAWYTYMEGGAVVYQDPRHPSYTEEELAEIKSKFLNVVVLWTQEQMWNMHKLQRFVEIVKPRIVANEVTVAHIEHREAGTVDNIIWVEGGKYPVNGSTPVVLEEGYYIFDLKSGKTVSSDAYMQVADYVYCAETMDFGPFKGALIGHTQSKNKNGIEGFGLHVLNREQVDKYYQDYRDIARVWERQFASRKPVIRQIPALITRHNISEVLNENSKTKNGTPNTGGKADEGSKQQGSEHLPVPQQSKEAGKDSKRSAARGNNTGMSDVAKESKQGK